MYSLWFRYSTEIGKKSYSWVSQQSQNYFPIPCHFNVMILQSQESLYTPNYPMYFNCLDYHCSVSIWTVFADVVTHSKKKTLLTKPGPETVTFGVKNCRNTWLAYFIILTSTIDLAEMKGYCSPQKGGREMVQ